MMLCTLCRAFPRYVLRVEAFRKDPDPAEGEKLFSAACWVIAALERTRPCVAHPRTLRRAKRLTDTLARLIAEEEHSPTLAAALAPAAAARKEIQ